MQRDRIKIGFFSRQNYFDKFAFSGTLNFMYRSLAERAEIVPLGRPYRPSRLHYWVENVAARWRKRGNERAERKRLDRFLSYVDKQICTTRPDVIFAPIASHELSILQTNVPALYASDATFRIFQQTYQFPMTLERFSLAEAAERAAITGAAGITYPSTWAAKSAVEDYGAAPEKIRVIPYGANVDEVPNQDQIREKLGQRPWRLLFIGVNWERKGGDVALQTHQALVQRGIEAELTIIGCQPPNGCCHHGVRVISFIDKHSGRGARLWEEILLSSHCLLFPSRADCSPIALCEAAAYGIPVVASDVGGIRTIVTAESGMLVPSDGGAREYADRVESLLSDSDKYRTFVTSSRMRYEAVLNWDKWARSVVDFCHELA
jgi:glycosyltransferase involved in cell wall biosynthesis